MTPDRAATRETTAATWIVTAGSLGLILGMLVGAVQAFLEVRTNRLFDFGLHGAALHTIGDLLNRATMQIGLIALCGALIGLVLAGLCGMSFRRLRDIDRAAVVLLSAPALVLAAWGILRLNKVPGFPDFLSPAGLCLSGLVAAAVFALPLAFAVRMPRAARWISREIPRPCGPGVALVCVLALLAVNAAYVVLARRNREGPNVLFITVDTLRADHLGCYGYRRNTSPRLDRLAREGVLFTQAAVQWPKTTPSLASMLTGTYGHYNGVLNNVRQPIHPHFLMLPELLVDGYYDTVGIVTNGNLAREFHFDQGFRTYVETWQASSAKGDRDAADVTGAAVSWLRRKGRDRKFFMWLHYYDPHAPYIPPPGFDEMFVGDDHYDPSRRARLNPTKDADIGGIPERAHLGERTETDYYVAQYDAEIRFTDEQIGRVLDEVDALDLADDTLVVFTADHGESLGEHNYFFEHGRLPYDGCVRAPLIVRMPGLDPPRKVLDHPVELISIVPTVLEFAGLRPNPEAQGRSLIPLLRGDPAAAAPYAFTESGYRQNYQRMVRTDRWKLIYAPDPGDQKLMQGMPFELYDLRSDPGETRNLVAIERETALGLSRVLLDWMAAARPAHVQGKALGEVELDPATEQNLRSLGYIQ